MAQSHQPDVDQDETTPAVLRHMVRQHIIEKIIEEINEEYRFEVPLVEIWVRERAMPTFQSLIPHSVSFCGGKLISVNKDKMTRLRNNLPNP